MEIHCLGVLRVLGVFLGHWRENVGRALARGRSMDQITENTYCVLGSGLSCAGRGQVGVMRALLGSSQS